MAQPAKKTAASKKASTTSKPSARRGGAQPKKAAQPKRAARPKKAVPAKKAASAKSTTGTKKSTTSRQTPSTKSTNRVAKVTKATRAKAANAAESTFFKRAFDRANQIANDPDKLREVAEKASRSSALRSGPFDAVIDDFRTLTRLVVAYARGYYRQIPVDKLALVVGGLIYVVSPVDAIPDAIPVAGFLDDVAVIGWVIKAVREELDEFREWEAGLVD